MPKRQIKVNPNLIMVPLSPIKYTSAQLHKNTKENLFIDKKKNIKLANIWPSLHFYGMIILVKKGLCRRMAWLPFQKGVKWFIVQDEKVANRISYLM